MDQGLLDRINELAHKAKTVGLDEAEIAEREVLRKQYREAFRRNLVVKIFLRKKGKQPQSSGSYFPYLVFTWNGTAPSSSLHRLQWSAQTL